MNEKLTSLWCYDFIFFINSTISPNSMNSSSMWIILLNITKPQVSAQIFRPLKLQRYCRYSTPRTHHTNLEEAKAAFVIKLHSLASFTVSSLGLFSTLFALLLFLPCPGWLMVRPVRCISSSRDDRVDDRGPSTVLWDQPQTSPEPPDTVNQSYPSSNTSRRSTGAIRHTTASADD